MHDYYHNRQLSQPSLGPNCYKVYKDRIMIGLMFSVCGAPHSDDVAATTHITLYARAIRFNTSDPLAVYCNAHEST